MSNSKSILIVAAHPDDEVIGMGGSICKFSNQSQKVRVLFLSSGVGSRNFQVQSAQERIESAKRALAKLGCSDVFFGDFPDNMFDTIPLLEIVKFIESYVNEYKPDSVFTNYFQDLNIDHRITSEATQVAVRPKPNSSVNALYYFEVNSSTGWQFGTRPFNPNFFIDVSEYEHVKSSALTEYIAELDEEPGARSMSAVLINAKMHGSFIGFKSAEAFEIGFVRTK